MEKLKFIIPTFLTILLFVILIFGFLLPRSREICIKQQQQFVEQLVNGAATVLGSYHNLVQSGEISEKTAKERAIRILRQLRHGDKMKNYFWIVDKTPRVIMHPYRSDMEGDDVSDYQDRNGVYIFRKMVEVVERQEAGYISYVWQYHDFPEQLEPKLSYVKEFKPWGWIIGTGMYVEQAYKDISALTKSMTVTSSAAFVLILLFTIYLMRLGMLSKKRQFEAMDKLMESEHRYKALVEFMNEGLVVEDSNGKITYVNRRFCEMVGRSKEETIGSRIDTFVDDTDKQLLEEQHRARRTGKKETYELLWKRKDGGPLYSIISPQPIFSHNGTFRGSFAVITDITKREQMEKELHASVREKEALLKEVHHRVKNNLQLIISLLSLQRQYVEDVSIISVLADSQNRIQTMAHVHELLYQSGSFNQIDLSSLFNTIVQDEKAIYAEAGKNIDFRLNIDDVQLEVHYAIPCGLVVNELVSNALKYAFPESGQGNIVTIIFKRYDGSFVLEVTDNGIGLPEGFAIKSDAHLGLQLVEILVQQLGGDLSIVRESEGGHFKIFFAQE